MLKGNRGERNRSIVLSAQETSLYLSRLLRFDKSVSVDSIRDTTINQDIFDVLPLLPDQCVDLLFIDPPYNITKSFNSTVFRKRDLEEYATWFNSFIAQITRLLKPTASIYVCGDWRSSAAIHYTLERYFIVRNRITWEREKGRGAVTNWKNCSEDIWYCTVSDNYTFNVDAVKLKRKVLAPYKDTNGKPKDWEEDATGAFRVTYPSNIWTDITVPFWSMSENTDHPTQKPEKLLAKIILASSLPGQLVLDPFLGSGTTSVVAKKLARAYAGVEIDETYCCLTEKRLDLAAQETAIQGYSQGVFWERNTLAQQRKAVEV
ncbi:MAG TPA: DNA methyltransferase [Ktedonobacteraceae bacterium]|nr:DNA methyltransferase [Ktedonobacteraceae bacterium]